MEFAGSRKITITRLVETKDSVGGVVRSYTKAARAGLPTVVKARVIHLNEKQKLEHGVRGDVQGFKFLCEKNPRISLNDRIQFDITGGGGVPDETITIKVLNPSRPRSLGDDESGAQFWRVIGELDSSES